MKEVLELIQKKKEEYAELRFFKFIQDSSIDPMKRVSWAPCLIPFAMNFKDLNALAIREEPTTDPIQEMLNKHTYEDDRHWAWYLSDIEALGINFPMQFTEVLKFLWGKETESTRKLCYKLFALCQLEKDPIIKLVTVTSIEATGVIALTALAKLGSDLEQITKKKMIYFSNHHLGVETGQIQGGLSYEATDEYLHKIELTEEQKTKACEAVETVFKSFSESAHELMVYAEKHTMENPFSKMPSTQKLVEMVA
ncbi:MAG: hypothetical protein SW833_05425 [Cyanobacteriota bacterium]|nr:hypothetical protein [Cyanobacteriota bacterium]